MNLFNTNFALSKEEITLKARSMASFNVRGFRATIMLFNVCVAFRPFRNCATKYGSIESFIVE